jgi:hypothetical protein
MRIRDRRGFEDAKPNGIRIDGCGGRRWNELHALMDSLTPEQAAKPGYYSEGWSAKDLLAHLGSWLAEAGVFLLRIRVGTYKHEEIDIDAMNRTFLEIMKDVPLQTVRAQASAARLL